MRDTGGQAAKGMARLAASSPADELHSDHLEIRAIDSIATTLADLGQAFGGDMKAVTILLLLARAARGTEAAVGMTQSEIAARSGIPRETVRRKLVAMERPGWIVRHESLWYLNMTLGETKSGDAWVAIKRRYVDRAAAFVDEVASRG
ncbi:hypothetical protein DRV85_00405 [Rhodosalinus halophilus]|uniref:HTH crp-type domain-containing protein n=2 Tax=Rhodosalinus halophilus TaxID=2259333 RepID=A0A365UF10_9RHOB|nr:helix-turn-helix domain-containing protein [Rhodosalinus halophilus]RBI87433.1 hypothetical protein DRV85_00405 [Rhodosalinus halophilus]